MAVCTNCGFESQRAFRFCPECGTEQATASPAGEQRRVVTVLFCDLTGSTALGESLDPERLRALLARYFERMQGIIEWHGGTVEKFIGDAVMAVFGVPTTHEDDALRAVRAAVEMRDALPELDLQGRIGVMTGEVVAGTAERLVTGDPVNVAARLEAAAQPGTVLVGQPTFELVAAAVDAEAVEPLMLKGKADHVRAYRLLAVHDAPERRHDRPFVGRDRDLTAIKDAWRRVVDERSCALVTVVGDAGIGKSRLAAEVLATVDARVLRGRCLPYGEGITYWPVVEVLQQLGLRPADERAATAISAVLGESEASTSADEIAWAFRKTLEHAAADQPLVVLFDDIQWGESTFHDLVEHVALLSTGASILLLCMARPDLAEQRPTWPVTIRLEPLTDDDIDQLIPGEIDATLRQRIAHAAGGNPLFIGEMVTMADGVGSDVVVPPSLRALIAARLDQLDAAERAVLECGSIEGEVFHRGAVQAIAPGEEQATPRLAALVRKEMIRPNPPLVQTDDGFRFRHLLIRDVAYDGLPKSTRAELHERFASWLVEHGDDLVELDELLGYHLEQAWRYHTELDTSSEHRVRLATSAHQRLARAGSRASHRQDYGAGLNFLERAAAMRDDAPQDARFEIDLAWARFNAGQEPASVLSTLSQAADRAGQAGAHLTALGLRLDQGAYEVVFHPTTGATERLGDLVEEALPLFVEAGDDWGAALAYMGRALLLQEQSSSQSEIAVTCSRMLEHARLADSRLLVDWAEDQLLFAQLHGSTSVEESLRWLDTNPSVEQRSVLPRREYLLAQLGRFEEAHALLTASAELVAERGSARASTVLALRQLDVAMLEGKPAVAEAAARAAYEARQAADASSLMWWCCDHARALLELGRDDEADEWLALGREQWPSTERIPQMLSRQVAARLLARRGESVAAEQVAREAVALADETDMLNVQGDAYTALAEVLRLGGKPNEGADALREALARYERKGNLASARHAREHLAVITSARQL